MTTDPTGDRRRTGRPLLIFDGECGFCTTLARFGQRLLGLEHVESWQLLDLDEFDLTEAQCDDAVQWVAADGIVASAHHAVIAAFRHAGGIGYRWSARNRQRLPGGTPACALPKK